MKDILSRIEVIKGDITTIKADAIVNAANSSLMGGGGVDGAIHRVGGKTILEECKEIVRKNGPCKTGESVLTSAGNLPAKFVIHTVGPVWNGGHNQEESLLKNCYVNSLKLAVKHDCNTIAFPNISTGVYHFPKEKAASISIQTVIAYLEQNNSIKKVTFVCFDDENDSLVRKKIQNIQHLDYE
ncbi:MAG: O-acetyl-ADP-ribose deacetylase [Ginsengibacter sp.]